MTDYPDNDESKRKCGSKFADTSGKELNMELSEKAKQIRREYFRKYYQAHKAEIKERNRKYWERKALQVKCNEDLR